jgi:hypothetical protein
MRRLTYSPKVNAYIRPSNSALGIIDVSPYIVRGNVHRKTDQVSEATIEMRNPFKQFTVPGRPMFHPMDPVTIYLTRLRGHPIQVFTGYLDETPYLQLFPDTITLSASCTLKRLLYTYWDPGLPHVTEFMARYGWEVNRGTGQLFNPDIESVFLDDAKNVQLQDGSIGNLLFATLKHVGSWDSNTIFIEKLPDGIVESVSRVYNDIDNDNQSIRDSLKTFLHKAIRGQLQGRSTELPASFQSSYKPPRIRVSRPSSRSASRSMSAALTQAVAHRARAQPATTSGFPLPGATPTASRAQIRRFRTRARRQRRALTRSVACQRTSCSAKVRILERPRMRSVDRQSWPLVRTRS